MVINSASIPIQDIDLSPEDPDYEDDNCLDDLLKGPETCDWRKWIWGNQTLDLGPRVGIVKSACQIYES